MEALMLLQLLVALVTGGLFTYFGQARWPRSPSDDDHDSVQVQGPQEQVAALSQENRAQKARLDEKELACSRAESRVKELERSVQTYTDMVNAADLRIKSLQDSVKDRESRVTQLLQHLKRANLTHSGAPQHTHNLSTPPPPTTPPLLMMNGDYDLPVRTPPEAITIRSPVPDNRSRSELLSALIEHERVNSDLQSQLQACTSELGQARRARSAAEEAANKQAQTNKQLGEQIDQLKLDNQRLSSTSQQVQAECSNLGSMCQQLESRCQQLQEERDSARSTSERFEAQAHEATQKLEAVTAQLAAAQETYDQCLHEKQQLEAMQQQQQQLMSDLQHGQEGQRMELEQVKSDCDQLQEMVQELQIKLQAAKDHAHEIENNNVASLYTLAQEEMERRHQESLLVQSTCQEHVDDMTVALHHHTRNLAAVAQEGVPLLMTALQDMEQLVDELQKEAAALREANTSLTQQVQDITGERDVLASECRGLQRVRDAHRDKLAGVEADREQMRAAHASEVHQLREQVDTVQFSVAEHKAQEQQLLVQLQQLQTSLQLMDATAQEHVAAKEQLQSQVLQLTAERQQLQLEAGQLTAEGQQLQSQVEQLMAQQQQQQEQAAVSRTELQSRLDEALSYVDKLQAEHQQKVADSQKDLDEVTAAKQELQHGLKELTSQLQQLTADNQQLTADKQALQVQLTHQDAQVQALKEEKQQLQGSADQLQSEVKQLTTDQQARLEAEKQLTSQVEKLQVQLTSTLADKQQLQAQVDDMQAQLEQLTHDKAQLLSQVGDFTARCDQLVAEVSRAAAERQQAIQQAGADKQQLVEQSQELRAAMDALTVEVERLRAANQQLQGCVDGLKAQVEQLDAERQQLTAQAAADQQRLEDEKERLQACADGLQAQVEKLTASEQESQARVGDLQARRSQLEADKQQLQQRVQGLQHEVQQVTAEKQQLQEQAEVEKRQLLEQAEAERQRVQDQAAAERQQLQAEMAISLLPIPVTPSSPRRSSKVGKLSPRESHTGADKQQQHMQELEAKVAQLTADNQRLQASVDDLQAELAQVKPGTAQVSKASYDELAAQRLQTNAKLQAVQVEYALHKEKAEAAAKALQQELTSQRDSAHMHYWSARTAMTTELEAAQARIASLEQQLTTAEKIREQLEQFELAKLPVTPGSKQQGLRQAVEQPDSVSSALQTDQAAGALVAELQAKVAASESRAQLAEDNLAQVQHELMMAEGKESPQLLAELEDLQKVAGEFGSMQVRLEALAEENTEILSNYKDLRALHDDVLEHREQLLAQIATLESDRAADQAKVSLLNREYARVKQEKGALHNHTARLQEQVDLLNQQLQQANSTGHHSTAPGHVFVELDQSSGGGTSTGLSAESSSGTAGNSTVAEDAAEHSVGAAAAAQGSVLAPAGNPRTSQSGGRSLDSSAGPSRHASLAVTSPALGTSASQELSPKSGALFRGLLKAVSPAQHEEGTEGPGAVVNNTTVHSDIPPQIWESESSCPASPTIPEGPTSGRQQVAFQAVRPTGATTPRMTCESLPDFATSPLLTSSGFEATTPRVKVDAQPQVTDGGSGSSSSTADVGADHSLDQAQASTGKSKKQAAFTSPSSRQEKKSNGSRTGRMR